MSFEAVIGLEIHVQLKTKTKMFCSCRVVDTNSKANTSVCPVCMGYPGALPVPNKKAVELAVKIGKALNMKINRFSLFARKNYFYPDLPKGYQISQYDLPICQEGWIDIGDKIVRIKRAHLEEDAGKSLHAIGSEKLDYTLVDFNRCGVPLVEIVSYPDISTPDEAYRYLVELKKILRWIDVSNCDMEKGELRCDVNISVREYGSDVLGTKVEIKNLNSFKSVKDAISYEIERQIGLLKDGGKVEHETRLWDSISSRTFPMRKKETTQDYRYFHDPDLPPLVLSDEFIDKISAEVGKLPMELKRDFSKRYEIDEDALEIIFSSKHLYEYFEKIVRLTSQKTVLKNAINIINTQILGYINERGIPECDVESVIKPEFVLQISEFLSRNEVSSAGAKTLFEESIKRGKAPAVLIDDLNLRQISDLSEIQKWVMAAIEANPKAFEDFKKGNEKASGPLVGYVMRQSKGRADPKIVIEILKKI